MAKFEPDRRRKRCKTTKKVRWLTRLDATMAAANLARGRAYQCEFCGDWHLSSQEKRGRS